jgi:hypothetical protein
MNVREQPLVDRLRMHVERLAADIGERKIFVPAALQRAAVYIEGNGVHLAMRSNGSNTTSPERCANLVAERKGSARQNEILQSAHT